MQHQIAEWTSSTLTYQKLILITGVAYVSGREYCAITGQVIFFLQAGKTGRFIGFVKTGILKYIVTDSDGNEHIINLEFAGEFVADFPDSIYGIPSKVSIKAISPCEIYCVSTGMLRNRMYADSEFQFIVSRTSEKLFRQVYERLIESYTIAPRERYEQLVAKYPRLFEMFQLKDIASFLRITPGHLSRLRKEIKEKYPD